MGKPHLYCMNELMVRESEKRREAIAQAAADFAAKGFEVTLLDDPVVLPHRYLVVEWSPGYKRIVMCTQMTLERANDYLQGSNADSPFVWEFVPLVVVDLETGTRYEARPASYLFVEGGQDDTPITIDGFTDGDRFFA